MIKNLKKPSVNTFSRIVLGVGGTTLALGSATCSVLAYQQNFASQGLVVSGLVLGIAAAQEIVKVGLNIHVARCNSGCLQKAALVGLIAFSTFGTGEYLVNAYQHGQAHAQQLRQEIAAAVTAEADAQGQIQVIEQRINALPSDWVTAKRHLMADEAPYQSQLEAARAQETTARQELVTAENNNGLTAESKAIGVKTDTLAYSLIGLLCVFFEPLAALSINASASGLNPAPVAPAKPTRKPRKTSTRKQTKKKAKKAVKAKRKPAKKKSVPQPTRTPSWNRALNRIAAQAAVLMV